MNIIIWLVVGGLIGWAASTLMRTPERIVPNVVIGTGGATLGGWFLSPMFVVSTLDQSNFTAASFLGSLLGATLLLVIVNWLRRAALPYHGAINDVDDTLRCPPSRRGRVH